MTSAQKRKRTDMQYRSWKQIYGERAFLTGHRNWKVIIFNGYMKTFELELISKTRSTFLQGSVWRSGCKASDAAYTGGDRPDL